MGNTTYHPHPAKVPYKLFLLKGKRSESTRYTFCVSNGDYVPLSRRFPFLALYQVLFFKSLSDGSIDLLYKRSMDGSPSTLNAYPIKGYRLLVSGSPKVENLNISKTFVSKI